MVRRLHEWERRLEMARVSLEASRQAIAALSELAESTVDMKLSAAGSTLEGTAALLREADSDFRKGAVVS